MSQIAQVDRSALDFNRRYRLAALSIEIERAQASRDTMRIAELQRARYKLLASA